MLLLKKSKTAIPAIFAIALIALSIAGFSYAHWSEYLWLYGEITTGDPCMEFVPPVTKTDHGNDWTCDYGIVNVRQIDKDIGSSSAYIVEDTCPDTIMVILDNVYPCYYEHIAFWIHNCGTVPMKIYEVTFNPGNVVIRKPGYLQLDLDGDTYADVEIYWGNNFGVQIDPCERVDLSFDIHILQKAPEGTELSFTVEICTINWNETPP